MCATLDKKADEADDPDVLAALMRRLNTLEANNVSLARENSALRRRIEALETQTQDLTKTSQDLLMKVAVLRQPGLSTAAQRVFGTFELLEQILVLCPTRQLFELEKVCRTFSNVLANSPPLLSRTFKNIKDTVSPAEPLDKWRHLWPVLRLNRFWAEQWQRHPTRVSLTLKPKPTSSSREEMNFRITDGLAATFEYRITTSAETASALEAMSTSLGRSYLTQPALPTSVWVSFLDTSILRNKQEYLLACRTPLSVPPNVTAQARVKASTVLEMLQLADLLHRYHHCKWFLDNDVWYPENVAESDLKPLPLITEKPIYSGWRAVQPRSGHIIFDT